MTATTTNANGQPTGAQHHLDALYQKLVPTITVPLFSPFEPLQTIGHRFLNAKDGLYLEIRNSWLYARIKESEARVPRPYGEVGQCVEFLYGDAPNDLIAKFKEQARTAFPLETGAWITWTQSIGFRYHPTKVISASGVHLNYAAPDLEEGETLVLDLHSHGKHSAFFSEDDNRDDQFGVYFSGVVGKCADPVQDMAMRLCVMGMYLEIREVLGILGNKTKE